MFASVVLHDELSLIKHFAASAASSEAELFSSVFEV
jgi:hypothetical protein